MSSRPFVIVGCGAAKRAAFVGPVRELYVGSLFRARAAYASTLGGIDAIVSAELGLVGADTIARTYERDLRRAPRAERERWSLDVLASLRELCPSSRPVVALVAGPYAGWVPLARAIGYRVEVPLEGATLGASLRGFYALARGAA